MKACVFGHVWNSAPKWLEAQTAWRTNRQAKTVKPCRTLVKGWSVTRQQLSLLEQTLTELQRAVTFSDFTSVTIKFSHSKYFPSLEFWIPCFSYAPFGCNYRSLWTSDWKGAHVFSWELGIFLLRTNTVMLPVWQDGMRACGPNDVSFISINTLNLIIYCKICPVALSETDRHSLFPFPHFPIYYKVINDHIHHCLKVLSWHFLMNEYCKNNFIQKILSKQ